MRAGALFAGLAGLAALGAIALLALSDQAWLAGYPRLADLIGVSRLAACWLLLVPAWKTLHAIESRACVHLGRTGLAAILLFTVLT